MDRYSEDLDFSLLKPDDTFSLGSYGKALEQEIGSFGFHVDFEQRSAERLTAIESAFLKTNTHQQLIVIGVEEGLIRDMHKRQVLKIKLEVDTDPPGGFITESRYILQPIPFAVRTYSLPDLFAGKLHAVLCRRWKSRIKGRDWHDLVWYCGHHPRVRLSHLETRMRQSGDYTDDSSLTASRLQDLLQVAVAELNIDQARAEVAPFLRDQRSIEVWSKDFFRQIIDKIESIS